MFVTTKSFDKLERDVERLSEEAYAESITVEDLFKDIRIAASEISVDIAKTFADRDEINNALSSTVDDLARSVGGIIDVADAAKHQHDAVVLSLVQHIDKISKRLEKIETSLEPLLDHQHRKESDEPWLEVLGGDIDDVKGVELKLDWNDAFIDQLRSQGYTGTTETTLVGKYLLTLGNTVASNGGAAEA